MLSASTVNQIPHDLFSMTAEIGSFRDPPTLGHGGEREALPFNTLQGAGQLTPWLLQEHVGRDAEIRVQRTRHLHSERTLTGEDFGDLRPAPEQRDQIPRREPVLLHTKAKGCN